MKYNFILFIGLLLLVASCAEKPAAEENTNAQKDSIAAAPKPAREPLLQTDYPDRVYKFRLMPDSTIEQQVIKYESFAALFIEYAEIYKNQHRYSLQGQEDNTEAYLILRDELVAIKNKLRKNISKVTKEQEKRLDAADARMNAILPNVYKDESPEKK